MRTRSMSDSVHSPSEPSKEDFKTPNKDVSKSGFSSNSLPPIPYSDSKQKIPEPTASRKPTYAVFVETAKVYGPFY